MAAAHVNRAAAISRVVLQQRPATEGYDAAAHVQRASLFACCVAAEAATVNAGRSAFHVDGTTVPFRLVVDER